MHIIFDISSADELLIQNDDVVDFTTPLTKKVSMKLEYIDVCKQLGVAPDAIFMHLLKVVGERIGSGDVLAQKKTLLGTKSVKSPYHGVLQEINHEDGTVALRTQQETEEVQTAFFKGKVELVDGRKVTLQVRSTQSLPLTTTGGVDFGGKLLKLDNETSLSSLTTDDVAGRVIIRDRISAADAVRLDVLDEAGIVTLEEAESDSPPNIARIKNVSDWPKLQKAKEEYALVDFTNLTLHLYEPTE